MFLRLREAITIIFPYLGLPTCMPACYGMIGVIQRKGAGYASTTSLRKKAITEDDVQKGTELRARIYRGVGNSDIFSLMDIYFTDLSEFHLHPLRQLNQVRKVLRGLIHSSKQSRLRPSSHGDISSPKQTRRSFNPRSRT